MIVTESDFYVNHASSEKIEDYKKNKELLFLGIPIILSHGIYKSKFQYIVLPSFESDVRTLFVKNNHQMPMHTIFRLAIQMINAYEYIHACKYVHADLKGRHIMIKDGMAYLMDFEIATPYTIGKYERNPENEHYGSHKYCSYDAHLVNLIVYSTTIPHSFILCDINE